MERHKITISVDLGPVEYTDEQIEDLKAALQNDVVAWLQSDVCDYGDLPVFVTEQPRPPRT